MADFYCGGCYQWVRDPHYCPGRQFDGKDRHLSADNSEQSQRRNLLRRKAELERELKAINLRLGGG